MPKLAEAKAYLNRLSSEKKSMVKSFNAGREELFAVKVLRQNTAATLFYLKAEKRKADKEGDFSGVSDCARGINALKVELTNLNCRLKEVQTRLRQQGSLLTVMQKEIIKADQEMETANAAQA